MNKANFQQTGGFPFDADTLTFMQSAYTQLSKFSGLGGQSYILDGCTVAGGNVTDGTVVIDGEVLPFVGGPKSARVIIEETVLDKTFEDGNSKPVYYTRTAKMAASGGVVDFDSLKRVSNLLALADRIKDQEIVAWTPTADPANNVTITGAEASMFRMGKLMILTGTLYYVYLGSGGVHQNILYLRGLPFSGDTAGISQYGFTINRDITNNGQQSMSHLYHSGGNYLTAIIDAPSGVQFSMDFSITLFTV